MLHILNQSLIKRIEMNLLFLIIELINGKEYQGKRVQLTMERCMVKTAIGKSTVGRLAN